MSNCEQRHLPKKLRGKSLYYRLWRTRGPYEPTGKVIAFSRREQR